MSDPQLTDLSLQIALEDILSKAPAKEPQKITSCGNAFADLAFKQGVARGRWEACQMLEAAMKKHGISEEELVA